MALELINLKNIKPTRLTPASVKITRGGIIILNNSLLNDFVSLPVAKGFRCEVYSDTSKKYHIALKISEAKGINVLNLQICKSGAQSAFCRFLKKLDLKKPNELTRLPHEIKDGYLYIDLSPLDK